MITFECDLYLPHILPRPRHHLYTSPIRALYILFYFPSIERSHNEPVIAFNIFIAYELPEYRRIELLAICFTFCILLLS